MKAREMQRSHLDKQSRHRTPKFVTVFVKCRTEF